MIKAALYTGSMALAPWRDALAPAFVASKLDIDVVPWQGHSIGAQYAIVWLPPRELFEHEPELRAVINLGAGVDALLARGVVPERLPIIRLVDVGMAAKIAEYVCFALARITRGLDRFGGPQAVRDWSADRPREGAPTVGVLGLGVIGRAIAQAAARFGYPVVGWSRSPHPDAPARCFAGLDQLDDFLAASDVLVNVLPLTPATENLLDRARLAKLPAGAHVINVGRGATIVDEDLLALLDSGYLASATLDVFRVEPLPPEHPFWHHPKVTVTPHLSGPTPLAPAAAQIVEVLAQLARGVRAENLPGYVDRARGY
jgi:glyoxylate/hydroxypyruvate reductase A